MGGTLTFPVAALVRELEAVKAATKHRRDMAGHTAPGFWLVGDSGVYLMGNHERGPLPDGQKSYPVVYAEESDPTTQSFDDWYANKHAIFGGDDGVEHFAVADIEQWLAVAQRHGDSFVIIEVTPEQLALGWLPQHHGRKAS